MKTHLTMLAIANSWGDTRSKDGVALYNFPTSAGEWREGTSKPCLCKVIARMIARAAVELAYHRHNRTIDDVQELVTLWNYTRRL